MNIKKPQNCFNLIDIIDQKNIFIHYNMQQVIGIPTYNVQYNQMNTPQSYKNIKEP